MNRRVLAGMLILVVIFSAFNPFASSIESSNSILKDQIAGIHFEEESWQNVLQNAKHQSKLVFLFAYTSACTSCQEILRETFTDQEVGVLFNRNFINLAIDIEHDVVPPIAIGNLGRSYPILIISDADGNMIAWVRGYTGTEDLKDFAKLALVQEKRKNIYL